MNTYQVLESIKVWILSQPQKPCLINVAGGSCSGKSYFSQQLLDYLSCKSVILNLDAYFLDITDPKLPHDTDGLPIFDEPSSYNQEQIFNAVHTLLEYKNIFVPIYNLERNQRTNSESILCPEPVIIADGLFAIDFLKDFEPNLNIFVEADDETCIRRRIERDAMHFNLSDKIIRQHYEQRIIPRQQKYVLPQKKFADFVVNTS